MPCLLLGQIINTSGFTVSQSTSDLEVCQGQDIAEYTITAKKANLNNFQFTLNFPPGIEYVPNSISVVATTPTGLTYTAADVNVTNLNQPVLRVSNGVNPATDWGIGHQIVVRIDKVANCPAIDYALSGSVFKDTLAINYQDNGSASSGLDTDTTYAPYAINYASLAVLNINTISTVINTTESRNITVRQGGNSSISSFQHIVVVERDIASYQLSFNGTPLTPNNIVPNGTGTADSLFYTIDLSAAPFAGAIGDLDASLENGEDVIFTETFVPTTCVLIGIRHLANWSCTIGDICQQSAAQDGVVTFVSGVPSLGLTRIASPRPDFCDTVVYTVRITNNGTTTTPAGGGVAYDVAVIFGLGANLTPRATSSNNTLWGSDRNDTRFWGNFLVSGTPVSDSGLFQNNNPGLAARGQASLLVENLLTTDPDGPGVGLEDLDGDGFFDDLAPGESFDVTFDYWIRPRSNCNVDGRFDYMTWEHMYFDVSCDNQCDIAQPPSRVDLGYSNFLRNYLNTSFVDAPTDIFDGQPFRVGVRGHVSNAGGAFYLCNGQNAINSANASWSMTIELPPGIDTVNVANFLNGSGANAAWVGDNPSITKIGNTVTFRADRYRYNYIYFPLEITDCNLLADTLSIPFTTHYLCANGTDTCLYRQIHCGSFEIRGVQCPGVCNPASPEILSFEANRTTAGYTNFDKTTQVTLDPAIHNTKMYYPFDTMLVEATMVIQDTAIGILGFVMDMTLGTSSAGTAGNATMLSFVGGELLINDVSSGLGEQRFVLDGQPLNLTNVAGAEYTYAMDLSRYSDSISTTYLFGGETGSTVYTPDTVKVLARFTLGNAFSSIGLSFFSPFRGRFTSLDANGVELSCNSLGDKVEYTSVNIGTSARAVGSYCNNPNVRAGIYHRADLGDVHPNEYREWVQWDSTKFILRGYRFTNTSVTSTLDGNPAPETFPFSQNGDTLTIYRPLTGYAERDKRGTSYFYLRASHIGTCETPENQAFRTINYYREYSYHPDPSVHINRERTQVRNVSYLPPTWTFQALTPSVNGTQDTIGWDMELCNTTAGADIGFNWLFIPPQPNIEVQAIYNITSGTPNLIPFSRSNDSIMVELGDLLATECVQLRIDATFNNCNNQSLEVNHGWDCQRYPTNLEELSAACYRTVNLEVVPQPAEVQVNLVTQPQQSIDLCVDTVFVVDINSAQLSKLTNPMMTIRGVTGFTISSLTAEYPRNSGNVENLTATIAGPVASIDLSTHTQVAANEGVNGTAQSTTVDDRIIRLVLRGQFGCDFASGSTLAFSMEGDQPCQQPAIGNGVQERSNPVNITGATAPYNAFTGTSVTPSPVVVNGCAQQTNIQLQTTIVGDPTTGTDTTEVILPPGVAYVPASFACVSAVCPSPPVIDTIGGRQRLSFGIPVGTTTGTTLDYNFNIQGSTNGGCTNTEILEINSYVIAGNINCLGTPCGPVKVITGEVDEAASIQKADLVLSNLSASGFNNNNTSMYYRINTDVTNNGINLGSGTRVDYYCLDAVGNITGSSIGSTTIGLPINAGQTINYQDSFLAPGTPCTNIAGLGAIIHINTASGAQCICSDASIAQRMILLPLQWMNVEAERITANEVQLDWTVNDDHETVAFRLEKKYEGQAIFTPFATVPAAETTTAYQYIDPNAAEQTTYYRIQQVDQQGKTLYSPTVAVAGIVGKSQLIEVYPSPTNGPVTIQFPSHNSLEKESVQLTWKDVLGRELAQQQYQIGSNEQLTLTTLQTYSSGVYYLTITYENEATKTFRIVKE